MNLREEEKKRHEKFVFDCFRNSYTDFLNGELIHDDKPDFIIKLNEKIIGVEVTQIFVDNLINNSSKIKEKEVLQGFLGDRLCEKVSLFIPFKFVLSIDFSDRIFYKNDIDRIVHSSEKYLKQIKFSEQSFTQSIENLGQLPDEIDYLYFIRNDKLNFSRYCYSDGAILPTLRLQNLKAILQDKEEALKGYKKCDEYWLLIEEGAFPSDSFGDISIKKFQTIYDKVFLYRKAHAQTIRLK
jgi:hypothetical protein